MLLLLLLLLFQVEFRTSCGLYSKGHGGSQVTGDAPSKAGMPRRLMKSLGMLGERLVKRHLPPRQRILLFVPQFVFDMFSCSRRHFQKTTTSILGKTDSWYLRDVPFAKVAKIAMPDV